MADMTLRRLADGETKTGPEGPVPEGFERIDKATTLPEYPGKSLGLPRIPNVFDAMFKPQTPVEAALGFGASTALTGGAGALASKVLPNLKYAPALARSAVQGVERATGAAMEGGGVGDIVTKGGMGLATGGATEGLMGLAGKIGGRLAGSSHLRAAQEAAAERGAAAFERAKAMPGEVFDAIKNRLSGRSLFGGGVTLPLSMTNITVPSMSKKAMPVQDAIERLSTLTSPKWEIAVDEIAAGLNKLDKTKAGQKAGDLFKASLPAQRVPGPKAPKPMLPNTNIARSTADALTGTPIEGIPAGALAAGGMMGGEGAPHIPLGFLLRGGH